MCAPHLWPLGLYGKRDRLTPRASERGGAPQHSSAKVAQIQRVNSTNTSILVIGARGPGGYQSQGTKKTGLEKKGHKDGEKGT